MPTMHYLDEREAELLGTLPPLPFARLVRQDKRGLNAAKTAFETTGTLPIFSYSLARGFPVDAYREALKRVSAHFIDRVDAVGELYRQKCDELGVRLDVIAAIAHGDDEAVTTLSAAMYGKPVETEAELAQEFRDVLAAAGRLHRHRDLVSAPMFAEMVRRTLAHYGIDDWTIAFSRQSSMRIGHHRHLGERPHVINIPTSLSVSRARAARLLTHEIEVHALRTANGAASPLRLLARGLAGYARTDEGLAVLLQQRLRTEGATSAGLWDAWATTLAASRGFRDVYDTLFAARHELSIAIREPDADTRAADAAWRLSLRAYRGITTPGNKGLGYMRDHIYRSGLIEVRNHIALHGDTALGAIFVGRCALSHLPRLAELGITSGRTPEMIGKHVVRDVMRESTRTFVSPASGKSVPVVK